MKGPIKHPGIIVWVHILKNIFLCSFSHKGVFRLQHFVPFIEHRKECRHVILKYNKLIVDGRVIKNKEGNMEEDTLSEKEGTEQQLLNSEKKLNIKWKQE